MYSAIFLRFATCTIYEPNINLYQFHALDHTKFTTLNHHSVQNVHFLDAEDDSNFSLKLVETLK